MKGLVAEAAGEKAGEGRPFCFPPIRKERRNNKPTVVYWTESKTRLKLWEFLEFSHYFKSKPQLFLENKVQKTPKIKPRQDHNQDYTSVYAAEVWGVGVVPACDGAGGRHWEESQQSPEKPQLLHLWQFWQDRSTLSEQVYIPVHRLRPRRRRPRPLWHRSHPLLQRPCPLGHMGFSWVINRDKETWIHSTTHFELTVSWACSEPGPGSGSIWLTAEL